MSVLPLRVALGLGANLGDRERTIRSAALMIDAIPGTRLTALSPLLETDPVGPSDQPRYLNAAALAATHLTPLELLVHLRGIERRLGRVHRERWREREIDIDILLVEGRVIHHPDLRVPHPEMIHRRFVLEPLAAIAPDMIHPTEGVTVRTLLARQG